MTAPASERTVINLRTGSRAALVVALLVVTYGVYQLWLPQDITGTGGVQFRCGSVLHPPSGSFQLNTCGSIVDQQRVRVIFLAIAAVVIAAGGIFAFGVDKRRETALGQRDDEDDEHVEPAATEHHGGATVIRSGNVSASEESAGATAASTRPTRRAIRLR